MVWGDKDDAVLMNNLQVLQNKAAKLVLDKPLYSSATDALDQLGWLNLKQRRHFHRCLYVYCMELHLTNWNYLETVMFIDTTLVAKIILDLHQLNGTRVNKEPVIMPLKTGMPWTVT